MAQAERAQARDEREQRILDAAAGLLLRWGYDKTTVDDVAREAAVAKGTIYLHWKNRDELFIAVLRRERVLLLTEVRDSFAAEPAAASLHALLSRMTFVYLQRKLLKALLVRDKDVIGKLGRQERAMPARAAHRDEFVHYLTVLADEGLIRADLSVAQLVNLASATFFGFFTAPALLPVEYAISDEDAADLLAETVCSTLERGITPSSERTQRLARTTMSYLDDAVADAEAKYRLGPNAARTPEQESVR